MKFNKLTPEEIRVIEHKGTELPFSGKYNNFYQDGVYLCKRCNSQLFRSKDKFNSNSGWPSFDDSIKGKVKEVLDRDGRRIEIICANCGAHLGHVFRGEQFTPKNTRHCVNSLSLNFEPFENSKRYKKAYFAGGCFWGVEYWFLKLEGVVGAYSGYMGGDLENPTYSDVCRGDTGHIETVEVVYDKEKVSYEDLVKFFFEIHDPTQTNGQGPDIGSQYISAIFYNSPQERLIAQKVINILEDKGMKIATKLIDGSKYKFYKAEEEHQNYYNLRGLRPYCHNYTKRF
jgi:peptide methionine sulfoxide reductase msrA/msrB